jgi:hypothetical protein
MADCKVYSLDAYRSGVTLDGTTLVWRGMRHDLAGPSLVSFVEALYESSMDGCARRAAGFQVWCDRRSLKIEGWDMGPMVLVRGAEVTQLGIRLLAAERRRCGAEGPVSA